jgi:Mrp family chromosome partitioning ATPase
MTQQDFERQNNVIKANMSRIKHKLVVLSGKGGVGKTTIAVNLAYALSLRGRKVGILDIDIHGPNIAKMLGIESRTIEVTESGIEPVKVAANLVAVSMALIGSDPQQAVIWRGPAKAAAIRQFLSDVNWGALDYLIIDSPPGTGDEPLCACQAIPDIDGVVIVTTPQDVAILDAVKSIRFARAIGVPVVGVIENMSGMICPHCKAEIPIFKKGGAEKIARESAITFLGRVMFDPETVELGDQGKPFVSFSANPLHSQAFEAIVEKIRQSLKEE